MTVERQGYGNFARVPRSFSQEGAMFEVAFDSPRRSATMLTSALLHLALLSALFTASFWKAGEPPDPPERILAFFRPPAEPIATRLVEAPRGPPEGGSRHATSPLPRRPAIAAPRAIPDAPPGPTATGEEPVAETAAAGEDSSLGIGPGRAAPTRSDRRTPPT
jgi:hypothetical protein